LTVATVKVTVKEKGLNGSVIVSDWPSIEIRRSKVIKCPFEKNESNRYIEVEVNLIEEH